MALSNRALLEVSRLSNEARSLARGTGAQRKEADVLLAKIAAINNAGLSPDEARERSINQLMKELGMPEIDYEEVRKQKLYEAAFRNFMRGGAIEGGELEARDLAAGSQSISYTEGSVGGYLVPQSVYDTLILGMSLVTPLLSPDVVTVKSAATDVSSKDARPGTKQTINPQGIAQLRPIVIPAWDTQQVSATRIGENVQNSKGSPMTAHGTTLNSYAYRTSDVAVPFEFEEDSFQDVMDQLTSIFSIGLARGVGADLEYGTGSSEPTGLITAAVDTGITIAEGSFLPYPDTSNVTLINTLEAIFFDVDRIHRAHPKCAWVMADSAWQFIRKNAPSASRPLPLSEGEATAANPNGAGYLFGKPVYIDNNIVGSNGSSASSDIVFGNLSRFVVRLPSGIRIKRNLESAYVTNGQALYTAFMRADSNIVAAGDEPIVKARITS